MPTKLDEFPTAAEWGTRARAPPGRRGRWDLVRHFWKRVELRGLPPWTLEGVCRRSAYD